MTATKDEARCTSKVVRRSDDAGNQAGQRRCTAGWGANLYCDSKLSDTDATTCCQQQKLDACRRMEDDQKSQLFDLARACLQGGCEIESKEPRNRVIDDERWRVRKSVRRWNGRAEFGEKDSPCYYEKINLQQRAGRTFQRKPWKTTIGIGDGSLRMPPAQSQRQPWRMTAAVCHTWLGCE
jgi:hypothetical protein